MRLSSLWGDVMAGGLEWGLDCLRSCLTVGRVSGVCFGKQEEREYMWMSKRGFSGGVWGTGVRVSTPLKGVCDHPAVTPYGGGGANTWCSEIWCILFHCKFNHHVDFFPSNYTTLCLFLKVLGASREVITKPLWWIYKFNLVWCVCCM